MELQSKRFKTLIVLLTGLVTTPLQALEYECDSGPDKRFIRMEMPGFAHLCEVTVTYSNDDRKVMWYANQDSMFCTEKTAELTGKYQNQWGFQCKQWPDHDGIDELNSQERTLVDTELKSLIESGKKQTTPFVVEGLKAASNDKDLLVLQFFLHEPSTGDVRDVTHVISDVGSPTSAVSQFDSLTNYVDANEGYVVNSALISAVSAAGAMEVITVLDAQDKTVSDSGDAGCYGNQTLTQQADGKLIPRTPHRFVCSGTNDL